MADKKISQLSAASTPLAGTEVLPIVQSSATVKVATNDLTVRNVRANATTGILQVTGPAAASTRVMTVPDANFTAARIDAAQTFTGDQTFSTGNIIQGTAAKGINFTANTPAAGMTSQLLNWYEDGTYTPVFTTAGGGQSVTYIIQPGNYVRIGKLVYFNAVLFTSAFTGGSGAIRVSLPFTKNSGTQEVVTCGETLDWVTRSPEAGFISSSASFASLIFNNGTGTTELTTSNITTAASGNLVNLSGVYTAA